MCGYDFEIGKEYLVYGFGGSGTNQKGVQTNSCTLTKGAIGETYKTDVKYLGKPLKFKVVKGAER
jgi:hypothetical protein